MTGPVDHWPLLAEETVLATPVFEVRRHWFRSPKDGRDKPFIVMGCPDWVQVLALTPDRRVLLVRQFRHGTRQVSLELPGGVIEPGQTPEEAGRRELKEETGYTADNFRQVAAFRPNPAIQDNTAYVFTAENARLAGPTDFDENEDLDLILVPAEDLRDLVLAGTVDHVIMAAAILFYFNSTPAR
ncbi:MAG: NUDIX hydrolase [Deltaproteobacteria bacterium]|nr:NUDIX hydrolase [Deltaproteobacteria bacterium]